MLEPILSIQTGIFTFLIFQNENRPTEAKRLSVGGVARYLDGGV
jgi:hypothetical protein